MVVSKSDMVDEEGKRLLDKKTDSMKRVPSNSCRKLALPGCDLNYHDKLASFWTSFQPFIEGSERDTRLQGSNKQDRQESWKRDELTGPVSWNAACLGFSCFALLHAVKTQGGANQLLIRTTWHNLKPEYFCIPPKLINRDNYRVGKLAQKKWFIDSFIKRWTSHSNLHTSFPGRS